MIPIYREPITPRQQKLYRELLYTYGRPMREAWGIEVLRPLAFTMPIVIVIVLYLMVWYIWPTYTDQALIIGAALICIALFALVKYYLLPKRAKSEAWYAKHFPDANPQPIAFQTSSSNRPKD
jgi:MFS superfamily sulfate permease-like transporter